MIKLRGCCCYFSGSFDLPRNRLMCTNLFGRAAFTLQFYFLRDGYQIKKVVWCKSTTCLWLGSLESILWRKCTSTHLKSLPIISISRVFKLKWNGRIQSRPDTEAGTCLFLICGSWPLFNAVKFWSPKIINSVLKLSLFPKNEASSICHYNIFLLPQVNTVSFWNAVCFFIFLSVQKFVFIFWNKCRHWN